MYKVNRSALIDRFRSLRPSDKLNQLHKMPWHTHAEVVPNAKSLSSMLSTKSTTGSINEAQFDYRDRMPEDFDYDWQTIILDANNGSIGEGSPAGAQTLNSKYYNTQIAIIGAGAAGLAAGYEMMKLGLQPIYFEMQGEASGGNTYARPCGRGYSLDFTDGGSGSAPAFTEWFPSSVSGPGPIVNTNYTSYGRQFVDMGAMRFPADHVALHTYVDEVFATAGDYYFGDNFQNVNDMWQPWRDPGVFNSDLTLNENPYGRPSDNDTSSSLRSYYRLQPGTTLGEVNPAINNLTYKNWYLLFGEEGTGPNGGSGYLRDVITKYLEYTGAVSNGNKGIAAAVETDIKTMWSDLNSEFEGASLFEVLADNNWPTESAYPEGFSTNPANTTLAEMFGEIGIGSGGFDVFWWTTFMETLRIRLHLDETDQNAVAGGTSYMISPFLTHNVETTQSMGTNLWSKTKGLVITDPVVAITPYSGGGVTITTRNSSGTTQSFNFAACVMSAAPPAVRARIDIDQSQMTSQAFRTLNRMRLTNCAKIILGFPNLTVPATAPPGG
jgi:Flavin containing amine oxidoreductase